MTFKKYLGTILEPQKSAFMVSKENPPNKIFFVFWLWFSFKDTRRTNVLLVGIIENAHKNLLRKFLPFWEFLVVNTGNVFLDVFKNTDQNNIGASIVFKAKYEENFFKGFYLKTQKCPFLGGQHRFFSKNFLKTHKKPLFTYKNS